MYLAGDDGVTRLPQLFAAMGTRSFYIRFRQNYPALRFLLLSARCWRYNVLLANDLDLPWFGIRPVIYRAGVKRYQDADIFALLLEWSSMLPHLEDVKMKNRMFVALLLAGVLALPALAQQAAPATQDQPAAAASGASGKPALQPDTHEGFWGKLNPFARKKYVQRQTAPIRDRVNELDELTSANSKMIKDTDARAQEVSAWPRPRPTKPTSTRLMPATRPRWRSRPRPRPTPVSPRWNRWSATSISTRLPRRPRFASVPARACSARTPRLHLMRWRRR